MNTGIGPGVAVAQKGRADAGRSQVPPILFLALLVLVIALLLLGHQFGVVFAPALAWGLALYLTGALAGFLFGIPKVPDRDRVSANKDQPAAAGAGATVQSTRGDDASTSKRVSGINSNLVEVSDWLTKIIVGVGLVELKKIPLYAGMLAAFIAPSLVETGATGSLPTAAKPIAAAIALGFSVLGFITGYLMTRIFLAIIMNDADRDAEDASWKLTEGEVVNLPTILSGLVNSISDLQSKVVQLFSAKGGALGPDSQATGAASAPSSTPKTASPPDQGDASSSITSEAPAASDSSDPGEEDVIPEPAATEAALVTATVGASVDLKAFAPGARPADPQTIVRIPASKGRVLWVDDVPQGNALIVDRLKRASLSVTQATTTADALKLLQAQAFDVVITDMNRSPERDQGLQAGIEFVRAVRKNASTASIPVLVYCGRRSADAYRAAALREGADAITSSEIELIDFLSQRFVGL